MAPNWKLGLGFTLITALMWGTLPVALKGLLNSMDPLTISWYRFASSALIAMLLYGRRNTKALRKLCSKPHRGLLLVTTLALLCNYMFYLFGLDYITASATQMIIQLAPLLLLLGGVFIFNEPFSGKQWGGVAIFTIGMVLFFHHRLNGVVTTDPSYLLGVALTIAAACSWATFSLAQKKLLKVSTSGNILVLICIAGTVVYFPVASPLQIIQLDGLQLGLLAFVCLNTLVSYGSFGLALSYWEASRASVILTIAPLITLLTVRLVSHQFPDYIAAEPLDWLSWTGGGLVVLGSIISAMTKKQNRT